MKGEGTKKHQVSPRIGTSMCGVMSLGCPPTCLAEVQIELRILFGSRFKICTVRQVNTGIFPSPERLDKWPNMTRLDCTVPSLASVSKSVALVPKQPYMRSFVHTSVHHCCSVFYILGGFDVC